MPRLQAGRQYNPFVVRRRITYPIRAGELTVKSMDTAVVSQPYQIWVRLRGGFKTAQAGVYRFEGTVSPRLVLDAVVAGRTYSVPGVVLDSAPSCQSACPTVFSFLRENASDFWNN